MEEHLYDKLGADLLKSGFASEMKAIQVTRDADWRCSGSGVYFDRDENITRSIDVRANRISRNWEIPGGIDLEYHLFIEVKKSERPWVVFIEREDGKDIGDVFTNPRVCINPPIPLVDLTPILREHSIRSKLKWLGYGVHEAFKKPQDTGRWYAAAVTVCKAAYDYVRQDCFKFLEEYEKDRSCLFMTHPVVLVDGPLYSVELLDSGQLQFNEIEFAPFRFEFGTDRYENATYRVDLVQIGALAKFLGIIKERHDALFAELYDSKRIHKDEKA